MNHAFRQKSIKHTLFPQLICHKSKKQMLHKNDLEHNFKRKELKNVKTLAIYKSCRHLIIINKHVILISRLDQQKKSLQDYSRNDFLNVTKS